jgi:cytidylate kinase
LKKLVIAIDGPAASGKSTTARLVAERLGYVYVDTGAMYRAMTLKVLERQIDLHDEERIAVLADRTEIRIRQKSSQMHISLDGKDVTNAIRSPVVTNAASAVSALSCVRDVMVREQRRMGEDGGIVVEGRDIGTVVFPNADVKIFMIADVGRRAQRRRKDLQQQGINIDVGQLEQEILVRDQKDSQRNISPLKKADDAFVLDTTELTIADQVNKILEKVEEVLRQR